MDLYVDVATASRSIISCFRTNCGVPLGKRRVCSDCLDLGILMSSRFVHLNSKLIINYFLLPHSQPRHRIVR